MLWHSQFLSVSPREKQGRIFVWGESIWDLNADGCPFCFLLVSRITSRHNTLLGRQFFFFVGPAAVL